MRLIDADELEKVMTEDWFLHILVTTKGKDAMKEALRDCIDSVPIAYDVEKIVNEIRKNSGVRYRDVYGDWIPPLIKTEEAIDIVKRGGVK